MSAISSNESVNSILASFSACPYSDKVDKGYYKDFAPMSAGSMQEVGELMYSHSLSCYLYDYALSKTDSGTMVHYRKAIPNITEAGNLIFIDIDNKVKILDGVDENGKPKYQYVKATGNDFISLERLRDALKNAGLLAVVTYSKSATIDYPKFHVAVLTHGVGDHDNFTRHYFGFLEQLGLNVQGLDIVMRVPVQNITPAYKHPERFIEVIEGKALDFTSLEPTTAFMTSLHDKGINISGAHEELEANYDDLVIRRENEGDHIEDWEVYAVVKEALINGVENGKVRTQCHHGMKHDGRYDAGFIRFHEGNTVIMSHCSVCGDKVELWREDITDHFDDLGKLPEGEKPKDFEGQPLSLEMLFNMGVAIDYKASNLEPLDDQKILFDNALHLFYAPSGYFKSFTVASLASKTSKDVFYFDFEYNPAGLNGHCELLGVTYVSPPNDLKELKRLLKSKADCSNALFIFDSFSNLIQDGNNDATETANIVKMMRELIRTMGATIIFIDHATKTDYKTTNNQPKPWAYKLEGNESGKKKPCDLMYKLCPVDFEDHSRGVTLMVEKSRTQHRRIGEEIHYGSKGVRSGKKL